MKKTMAGLTLLTIVLTVFLGVFGLGLIRRVYTQEIRRTINLSGAVLEEYPQAEDIIIRSIHDEDMSTYPAGQDILSHYGYDEEQSIRENSSWQRFIKIYLGSLAGFLLLSLLLEWSFFLRAHKKRRRQEEKILSVLDRYFSEDYSFTADAGQQQALDNPHMADILVRIGANLQDKTDALAEERDHTKTLVTDISHQLKTPISALKTCFSMYLEADTAEEQKEFLERCQLQMDKLESLTASLIQISRLETSLITLQKEPVFLRELLTQAVNAVYHRAAQKEIFISTCDFEDLTLNLDRKWTTEAFVNLLDNAVKYTPPGGEIRLRVQPLFTFVRIELEDNGIGIPKEEQNHIFRRFYRGSRKEVRKADGSGVGLYLTRKILEEQGGTVTVRPAPVQGSIFVVQLPL